MNKELEPTTIIVTLVAGIFKLTFLLSRIMLRPLFYSAFFNFLIALIWDVVVVDRAVLPGVAKVMEVVQAVVVTG